MVLGSIVDQGSLSVICCHMIDPKLYTAIASKLQWQPPGQLTEHVGFERNHLKTVDRNWKNTSQLDFEKQKIYWFHRGLNPRLLTRKAGMLTAALHIRCVDGGPEEFKYRFLLIPKYQGLFKRTGF